MPTSVFVAGAQWRRILGRWFDGHGFTQTTRPERGAARIVFTRRPSLSELQKLASLPHPIDDVLWVVESEVPLATAIAAARLGVFDTISLAEEDGLLRLGRRLEALAARPALAEVPLGLVAQSAAARRMIEELARVATTAMPVLITGETGTGKEEAAHLIHQLSARRGPWVPINCAAIPNELMESELFGHVRGAFSGAIATVDGKLLAAKDGTVFLDEIDDTPMSTQAKLLRVLEDGRVGRVGENTLQKVDFRIIAATNRDLFELIAEKQFGRDFFERLAIVRIVLPPLRERREDIVPLVEHFMRLYDVRQGRPPTPRALCPRARAFLEDYPWPGNVRQLRNVVFQALVYQRDPREIVLADLRTLLDPETPLEPGLTNDLEKQIDAGHFNLKAAVEDLERRALRIALQKSDDSPTEAARLLGEVGHGRSRDPAGTVRAMRRRLGV